MRPIVAHCHAELGKICRRTDNLKDARQHLAATATMYRDMHMTYWLGQVEAEMRHLC